MAEKSLKVIVKTFQKTRFLAPITQMCFFNEIRNLILLRDVEGILRIRSVYENDGATHLVTQYEGKENLQTYISKMKDQKVSNVPLMAEPQIKQIMKYIIQAVSTMHKRQVLHRDIKPASIVFHKKSLRVCLVDFGQSLNISDQNKNLLDILLGTTGFIDPLLIQYHQ